MTCTAEIKRQYTTREEAFRYLMSRGFLCAPGGWENGRWRATVEYVQQAFLVRVELALPRAA
jgi:hypothetical protein